jgi:hypothetical protein
MTRNSPRLTLSTTAEPPKRPALTLRILYIRCLYGCTPFFGEPARWRAVEIDDEVASDICRSLLKLAPASSRHGWTVGIYRVRLAAEPPTDMVNLTRARDVAIALVGRAVVKTKPLPLAA